MRARPCASDRKWTRKTRRRSFQFACAHTFEETNCHVAAQGTAVKVRETAKQISADQFRVSFFLTAKQFQALGRMQAIQAQRKKPCTMAAVTSLAIDEFNRKHDPVAKADRAAAKESTHKPQPAKQKPTTAQKHIVRARDRGRCCHIRSDGSRCTKTRHTEIHHKIPLSEGGANDPSNLVTNGFPKRADYVRT